MEKPAEVLITGSGPSETAGKGATADTERKLAEVLADLVSVEQVSVDSHFFEDLGANSLVMAQFCARVRKRPDLPSVSMKDIYRQPTIRGLAASLADAVPVNAPTPAANPATSTATAPPPRPRSSTRNYILCGILQLLAFLAYSFVTGLVTAEGYDWVSDGPDAFHIYLRSVVFGGTGFLVVCLFPIAAKWILIGRWKPREFPVWGLTYLRFWIIKVLLHANPMILLVGNPLYVLYLRALGARIGKGVTILSRSVPVCTDLLTIGSGAVIRKDSFFLCYRAHAGKIQTGRVTLGRDVFVGEKTVLDIDTSMGDKAQLGHASALYRGQTIPDGEHHHGSPAQPTDIDHVRVAPASCGTARRVRFALSGLCQLFVLYIPLFIGGSYMLFSLVPALGDRLNPDSVRILSTEFLVDALTLSFLAFFGFFCAGLAAMCVVPRLLSLLVKPDRVYPLYSVHYAAHRAIVGLTNLKFFTWFFGDSSYIVHYLRGIGYDLSKVEQTGSNFGTEVQQETPFLASVGSGTMVADGLSILNAEYSNTSFRVTRASIGAHNFLGNNIAFPAGARTGENCLLATKVMVPLDGEIREGVGLLGSPSFEIPRSVERDSRFDHLRTGDELHRHLSAKNRYNARSMSLHLLLRWLHTFILTGFGLASVELYGVLGYVVIGFYLAFSLGFTTLYFVLVERTITSFRRLSPRLCSIYDPYFWWHERLWKVPDKYLNVFNGTPFKNVVWRLMGVRIGRRVFDDGVYMTERTLSTVGDDCTLNVGSKIQCHSQEDGTFKSDHTTLGSGCTLGVAAHVHYGVTIGDGAVLAPDSFLMKGEEVPPDARWGGNPAVEMPADSDQPSGIGSATATGTGSATADGAAATAS
ncbi:phosphopantetheine-binding protein [Streptomyces sp. RY43-2]|uniref:Phosphopantetheine-binding protein n=1 Tax=Streptomyces macrolidinus TaxID=2952607 RepID=A0ABT0ZII7_9ACTN|nr:Pls/PosA family non-ribosomal peptide synthetase [Streptomyces macrolidinus]MCN9243417.1 phosphopantetheine-binding protein [Streptomyces macrolidinus]